LVLWRLSRLKIAPDGEEEYGSDPPADETEVYYLRSGDEAIARAAVRVFRGCIDDVLVYKESNRHTSALYSLNEGGLGQPLRPSRIRSKSGRAFRASRRREQLKSARSALPPAVVALGRGQHLRKER